MRTLVTRKRNILTTSSLFHWLMILVGASFFHSSFSRAASFTTNRTTASSVLQNVLKHSQPTMIDDSSWQDSVSRNVQFIFRTEPVSSTQDEMRTILQGKKNLECVALVATTQTAGRGTQGRVWKAATGNLYLTVALPVSQIPVPVTLLPLQVGITVAQRIQALVAACRAADKQQNTPKVSVKWPNDVLINDAKVSGCLIEHYSNENNLTWFLVGIGVNVAETPPLQGLPGQHKRAPTSIREWCSSDDNMKWSSPSISSVLGLDIANSLADWVTVDAPNNNKGQQIVQEWRKWAEFGKPYELRGSVVDEDRGGYEGERVVTVDIEADGQLRVRDEHGRERLLVADYLV